MSIESLTRDFSRALADYDQRIKRLEHAGATTQLANSSIQNGFVHAYDASGIVRQRIGRQADGTFAVIYKNGPPPPRPTLPGVAAKQLAIVVACDGEFEFGVPRPADFARFDVHMSTTSGFEPDGTTLYGSLFGEGALVIPADNETHYVRVVAVSLADAISEGTDEIAIDPLAASHIEAGSIGAQQLAAEIILATTFISGDPLGYRLEIDQNGIQQYDDENQPTVSFGANPETGNYLTVIGTPNVLRHNLNPNPKLAISAADWAYDLAGGGARVGGARVSTPWCWRVISDGTADPRAAGPAVAVSPGQPYTAVMTFSPSAGAIAYPALAWLTAGSVSISVLQGVPILVAANGVITLTVSGIAPANAAFVRGYAVVNGVMTAGDFFDVSLMMVEPSSAVLPYFDGDSTNATWDGTVGASTSTLMVAGSTRKTLASLSDDGMLSSQSVAVAGDAYINGRSYVDTIAALPKGLLALGQTTTASGTTSTEIGWMELAFQSTAGRLTRLTSTSVQTSGSAVLRARYTTDGTAPSTTSPILTTAGQVGAGLDFTKDFGTATVRVLMSVVAVSGSVQGQVGSGEGMQLVAADVGATVAPTGVLTAGGGGAPAKRHFDTQWLNTWTQTYCVTGPRADGQVVQGFTDDGLLDNQTMIGFDNVSIAAALVGATITAVSLYLYSTNWFYNSGGTACIGTHNVTGLSPAPALFSSVAAGVVEQPLAKPEGRWVKLPIAVGEQLRDGTIKGITLDSVYKGHDLTFYGRFAGAGEANQPVLDIQYDK